MEYLALERLNVSLKVLRALLCNDTLIHLYGLNITCGPLGGGNETFNNTAQTVVLSPAVLKVVIMAGIIFLLGIISNVYLLLTSRDNKRLHKPSWKYVTNLAVADILCMILMAGFVLYILETPVNWSISLHSYLFPSMDIFLSSASMLSVTAIAVDRVYTIRLLQKQTSSAGGRNPNIIIACIWGYSIILFSLAMCRIALKHNQIYNNVIFWTATSVTLFGAVTVTFTCYVIIIIYYVKYTWSLNHRLSSTTPEQLLRQGDQTNDINMARKQKLKQQRLKKVLLTAFAPMPFIVGWSFFLGTQTYEVITKHYITDVHYNIAMLVVPWVVSALNPLVYMLLTASIRKQVRASLRRLFRLSIRTSSKSLHYNESILLTEI